ncbi:hypothetical protein EMWEY_00016300 [Eimeria maxima]|uniref:Transmembrane protein n=1 Tax=Eimeria maxima TaxID=5804 RepID=U6LX27_EIMMA|nr:hypothetical protein EMWEY_00016300 [Eimeria maxima]CDJ56286.1 hypothetical protein EMWEY_00016300 [Eimeria maxima]
MENKKRSFSILRLPLCFWLFAAFWIVEQQNVCSSKVPEVPTGTPELQVSNGVPPDSLRKLHSQVIAQKEAINAEFATRLVSKKRFHLIAVLVLILGLVKAISIRRQRKADEIVEPIQVPEDVSKEMRDELPQMPMGRERRTRREYRKPRQPSRLPFTPQRQPAVQPGGVEEAVQQPASPPPARQMPEVPEEEREIYQLRYRLVDMRSILNISHSLIDELPGVDGILPTITTNVETAEHAVAAYDNAMMRNDPQIASIRNETVNLMRVMLDGAREALLQIATMARQHGEVVRSNISQYCYFADTSGLRKSLDDSWETTSVKMCVASLTNLESIAADLQRETEEQFMVLHSVAFDEGYEAEDFVRLYGALAAMNFRKVSLETLSALDQALLGGILQMHKDWMTAKLLRERIPLEVDTYLVEGIETVLSQHRLGTRVLTPSEVLAIKKLLEKQNQDIDVMKSAQDIEAVTAAYERAKTVNQQLTYTLHTQKEKQRRFLEQNPLNKEENASLSDIIANIVQPGVKDSEEFLHSAQNAYAEAGGKIEDVAYSPFSGKGFLQKVATKVGTKVMAAAGVEQEDAGRDTSTASATNSIFTQAVVKIEAVAKNACDMARDSLQTMKKTKKYKLDKDGFGSSALDLKTQLRVDVVKNRTSVDLVRMRCRYVDRLTKEVLGLERLLQSVFLYPYRPSSSEWVQVGRFKEKFDREKALAQQTDNFDMLPKHFDNMLQLSFEIWNTLERERLDQLMQAVSQPSGSS